MSENDTSAIDDKKNENSSDDILVNVASYLKTLAFIILLLLVYMSMSGMVLFLSKLAQANILPTDPDCFPYTNSKRTMQHIISNIFPTIFSDPEMSMKILFPNEEFNRSHAVLDLLRNYKNKDNSHFLANYFISIVEGLFALNYASITFVMNGLNLIPEWVTVLFGPLLGGVLFAVLLMVNLVYTMYLWFAQMGWFFKTKEGTRWETVSITSPMNWGLGVGLVVLFVILYFVLFGLIALMPFCVVSFCLLSCLGYKALLNNEPTSLFGIISQLLVHYKVPVVTVLSFFIVALAFTKLGVGVGSFALFITISIYLGVITMDLFKVPEESGMTPSFEVKQAAKGCVSPKAKGEKEPSFLYKMLMGQKGGGGSIGKQLKKLHAKLQAK